ncbi:Pho80p cyclin [Dimargaris cristalligena]|nr:Pho80p cyclin [Dimargaris cristalligena]
MPPKHGSASSVSDNPPPPQPTSSSRTVAPTLGPPVRTLASNYYEINSTDLIRLVAGMLDQLIAVNDRIPFERDHLTRFHSRTAPNISVVDYLTRIVRYTRLENSCLLLILVYIDWASTSAPPLPDPPRPIGETGSTDDDGHPAVRPADDSTPGTMPVFHISSLTVHRFLITAVTISAKAICDYYCTNTHYARVGGVSIQEMNSLEIELLNYLRWRVTAPFEVLQQYYMSLVARHPEYQLPQLAEPPARPLSNPSEPPRSTSSARTSSGSSSRSNSTRSSAAGSPGSNRTTATRGGPLTSARSSPASRVTSASASPSNNPTTGSQGDTIITN